MIGCLLCTHDIAILKDVRYLAKVSTHVQVFIIYISLMHHCQQHKIVG